MRRMQTSASTATGTLRWITHAFRSRELASRRAAAGWLARVSTQQHMTEYMIDDPAMLELVSSKFRAAVIRELEQDIPIWENKIYISPPVLCDGDGPIGIFRKWVKQFYTDSQYERLEQGLDA